jgi:hypothetical protein
MTEATWGDRRIPGDPRFVRLIESGEVAMPVLTLAEAKWETRQAALVTNNSARARMIVTIVDQIVEEVGPRMASRSLQEIRKGLAEIATEGARR